MISVELRPAVCRATGAEDRPPVGTVCRGVDRGMIRKISLPFLCGASPEDCDHIFVTCPIARVVWASTKVCRPPLSSLDAFWRSVADGPYRRASEWQLIFATLWMLWIHRNEVIFRGRNPSADAVLHDVGGLVFTWNRAGLGPSTVVPL